MRKLRDSFFPDNIRKSGPETGPSVFHNVIYGAQERQAQFRPQASDGIDERFSDLTAKEIVPLLMDALDRLLSSMTHNDANRHRLDEHDRQPDLASESFSEDGDSMVGGELIPRGRQAFDQFDDEPGFYTMETPGYRPAGAPSFPTSRTSGDNRTSGIAPAGSFRPVKPGMVGSNPRSITKRDGRRFGVSFADTVFGR